MTRKKTKVKPDDVPDGRVIDLILPAFTKLGITFSDRPQPDILAGFVHGLLNGVLLWCEVWGGEDEAHVKIWSAGTFQEEQESEINAKIERINNLPECGADKGRWLKVVATERRVLGGRHVMLVARVKPVDGASLTAEFLEEKASTIVRIVKQEWPLRTT